ncbi:MAG: cellulase family glycosylhydrolase [Desulfobulbaceae bacterium]|nr:cellulase family glycosylhydrolase [Desulfobulbaceae bacterium]
MLLSFHRRRLMLLSATFVVICLVILFQSFDHAKVVAIADPVPSSVSPILSLSSPWQASVAKKTGLPWVGRGGATALSSSFVFWGANWRWASMHSKFSTKSAGQYLLTGQNKNLYFDLAAKVSKVDDHRMVWEFDFDARKTSAEVVGGGIEFKFNLATFGSGLGEPSLLPDNRGWEWGREGGSRIAIEFEPALAAVFFDRGEKNQLRAFFYKGKVPQGGQHYTVTLTLSDDIAVVPTMDERLGDADPASWPQDLVDWRFTPVDLSFLNATEKPAGRRGFVKSQGEQLVFADGTPARFWGTNITSYTLFSTYRDRVRQQAKRLSSLGFNLVRLHHHDSSWVKPNIFGDPNALDTQHLSEESLDRLDWWIKCLKDEGIYVWLDLHVGRNFTSGDGIDGFTEIAKGKASTEGKGYCYVNPSIQQAMKRFNEAYVTHMNSYTGNCYKDEPAIAAMLITNENDLTNHFGNALLPDKKVPFHSKLYMDKAADFARLTGLPEAKTWRSWEPGPSKIFLNDLEHRFNVEMIAQLRLLGVRVPIATTNTWGNNPLCSLPALAVGDVVDVHSYGGMGVLGRNPMIAANLVDWLAAGQVVGKPMSVTEWNVSPFPTPDRHAIPLYVAGSASFQGWDALMEYAYSQGPLTYAGKPSNWQAYNDPALLATLPAAALLYRQGHVREATTTTVLDLGRDNFFYRKVSPGTSVALRTAAEKGKLLIAMPKTKELPWLEPSLIPKDATICTDPDKPLLDVQAPEVVSDTGELRRNWDKGIYTINTPRTQAAMGWIGGEHIALPDVDITATTRNATVAVQSMDGQPISKSERIMISLGARSVPAKGNKLPYYSEPVLGQLYIRAPAGLKLFRSDGRSGKREVVEVGYKDGRYLVELDASLRTYWLFLEKI